MLALQSCISLGLLLGIGYLWYKARRVESQKRKTLTDLEKTL